MKLLWQLATFTIITCHVFCERQYEAHTIDIMNRIKSKIPVETQEAAVQSLITRTISKYKGKFDVVINPNHFNLKYNMDAFTLSSLPDNRIEIIATSGVAAASGFYHYVKYYCDGHVSWSGNQLNVPDILPPISGNVTIKYQGRYRYYQNVCTVSYSMAFWNWSRWEQEIDWMALNGINMPLAFTAQETIWQMVYTKLGLTQQELDTHFAGPAFLAWQRMGNLDGWGGPLPKSWYNQQLQLQHNILKRMRSFGMIPVLPGFAGHIPKPLVERLYPKAKYYKLNPWVGFYGDYRTYLLDSNDPLFQKIGSMFIQTQIEVYNGTEHVYNADVFNEMTPPSLTTDYMSKISASIFQSMKSGDSEAIWLMQGWMFLAGYWKNNLIEAWLNAIPLGKLIILDLASDTNPIYPRTLGYFGHPYLWCMIENFGGNSRLYGENAANIKYLGIARTNATYSKGLIGTGITPEGIEQNEINFAVMNELAWRTSDEFDLEKWTSGFIRRRYGGINDKIDGAWKVLMKGVYNSPGRSSTTDLLLVMRPRLNTKYHYPIWYDPKELMNAWENLVMGASELPVTETLYHDIAVIGNQVFEDMLSPLYESILAAYGNRSMPLLVQTSNKFLGVINDIDNILSRDRYTLLGNWLESAKRLGVNDDEKQLLEYNARNQITLWGPTGQISDYGNKNWAGLVGTYYEERWKMFTDALITSLLNDKPFDDTAFYKKLLVFEQAWTRDRSLFPTQPKDGLISLCQFLIQKYKYFS